MAKTESLGVRVQPEIKAALERAALDDHRSLSSLIEKILAEWLQATKGKPNKAKAPFPRARLSRQEFQQAAPKKKDEKSCPQP